MDKNRTLPDSNPDGIRRLLNEIQAEKLDSAQPEFRVNEELILQLNDLNQAFGHSTQLEASFCDEFRRSFGWAVALKLVDRVWDQLETVQAPENPFLSSPVLAVAVPGGQEASNLKTWTEIASLFAQKTGFSLPDASFQHGPKVEVLYHGTVMESFAPSHELSALKMEILDLLLKDAGRLLPISTVRERLKSLQSRRPELASCLGEYRLTLVDITQLLRTMLGKGLPILDFDLILETALVKNATTRDYITETITELTPLLDSRRFLEKKKKPKSGPGRSVVDKICLEFGSKLVSLNEDPKFSEELYSVFRDLTEAWGWIAPELRTRTNPLLAAEEYRLLLRGIEVARGTIHLEEGPRLEQAGCRVVSPVTSLLTTLAHHLLEQAGQLYSHQCLIRSLKQLRSSNETLVKLVEGREEILHQAKIVVSLLLAEKVPVVDLERILETLVETKSQELNPFSLLERVRRALGSFLVRDLQEPPGTLSVARLDKRVEALLKKSLREEMERPFMDLSEENKVSLKSAVQIALQPLYDEGLPPILLTPARLRRPLWEFLKLSHPDLTVLAEQEIPTTLTVIHR